MPDEPRVRPIDVANAAIDQLEARLNALSLQVGLLLFASAILSLAVGALLWRR